MLRFSQPPRPNPIQADPAFRLSRVTEDQEIWRPEMKTLRKFIKNSKGATAIEYGLIAALIAVAAIAAMQGLGNQLKTTFSNVTTNMKAT